MVAHVARRTAGGPHGCGRTYLVRSSVASRVSLTTLLATLLTTLLATDATLLTTLLATDATLTHYLASYGYYTYSVMSPPSRKYTARPPTSALAILKACGDCQLRKG